MSFFNSFEKLESRINELEDEINKLKNNEIINTSPGVNIYNKKLLNFQILNQRTLEIISLENKNKLNKIIFLQLRIKFQNYHKQNIQFKLFADDLLITQQIDFYENGINERIILGTFQNYTTNPISIKLQINAKEGKQINLIETTLFVYGNKAESNEEYNACMSANSILLTYINNKQLFYKIFNSSEDSENYDFNYLKNATSHSICAFNDIFYIFSIDENSNLFLYNISTHQENFINSNVCKVSCCQKDDSIIYCYISEGKIYYGEIINDIVISNTQLIIPFTDINTCTLNYNQYSKKCYLLLTKKDSSNYLLESLNNNFSSSENISANLSLQITSS